MCEERNLLKTIHGYFLVRYGLFFEFPEICHLKAASCTETHLQALDIMLAEHYNIFLSSSLREYIRGFGVDGIASFWAWFKQLWQDAGKDIKDEENMTPLMSHFPDNIPESLDELWFKRVLTLFQLEGNACNICGRADTVVQIEPCHHMVCSQCFSGYTGCPLCGRPIDRQSTFLNSLYRVETADKKAWGLMHRLDFGQDMTGFAKERFTALCKTAQALSAEDRVLLDVIIHHYADQLDTWLDVTFSSKQVQAIVLGAVVQMEQTPKTLTILRHHLKNATDVLRMIAVLSGEDGTLMPHKVHRCVNYEQYKSIRGHLAKSVCSRCENKSESRLKSFSNIHIFELSYQFEVAKMPRAQRRLYLSVLESFDRAALFDNFMRHGALWVRVGEFLHPGEYKKRFPKVAEAFEIIRKKDKQGIRAPKHRTWRSKFEQAIEGHESKTILRLMKQRPGESARHLDRLLRGFGEADNVCDFAKSSVEHIKNNFIHRIKQRGMLRSFLGVLSDAGETFSDVKDTLTTRLDYISAFSETISTLTTPMLIQLWGHFGGRSEKQKKRIFYPAGSSRLVYWRDDTRPTINSIFTNTLRTAIAETLLTRFEEKTHFDQAVIDRSLQTLTFPFGERSNRSEAIHVSPGSCLSMPEQSDHGKLRLFLHWCQKKESRRVDLDLSAAFYDEQWQMIDGCTYYKLKCEHESDQYKRRLYAKHSGDFQEAPYPRGASEYVDLERDTARAAGIRYAVMLVQVYAGVDFNELERAYVGIMYRDELKKAKVFDPQTVRYKYALTGHVNSYIPLVFDLSDESIHDIQCYVQGRGHLCNLDSNQKVVCDLARSSMEFYASKPRPMRYDIALMHAAARSHHVWIRLCDGSSLHYDRENDESVIHFYHRLVREIPLDEARYSTDESTKKMLSLPQFNSPSLAFLLDGDLNLKDKSEYYIIISGELSERYSWLEMTS